MGEAGAKVAIVDINGELAEETAHALERKGIEAIAVKADVTKPADVDNMIKIVVNKWGKLTIGVNNAGMGLWSDALTMPFNEWRKVLSLQSPRCRVPLCTGGSPGNESKRVWKDY